MSFDVPIGWRSVGNWRRKSATAHVLLGSLAGSLGTSTRDVFRVPVPGGCVRLGVER